jgi:hypothetical protein
MYCEVKTDTLNKVLYGLNIESKALNVRSSILDEEVDNKIKTK